jgi:hypothetical protein
LADALYDVTLNEKILALDGSSSLPWYLFVAIIIASNSPCNCRSMPEVTWLCDCHHHPCRAGRSPFSLKKYAVSNTFWLLTFVFFCSFRRKLEHRSTRSLWKLNPSNSILKCLNVCVLRRRLVVV